MLMTLLSGDTKPISYQCRLCSFFFWTALGMITMQKQSISRGKLSLHIPVSSLRVSNVCFAAPTVTVLLCRQTDIVVLQMHFSLHFQSLVTCWSQPIVGGRGGFYYVVGLSIECQFFALDVFGVQLNRSRCSWGRVSRCFTPSSGTKGHCVPFQFGSFLQSEERVTCPCSSQGLLLDLWISVLRL